MTGSIAIVCGGGPAPGINSVISSVSKVFLKSGYRVIGLHGGYKSLFSEEPVFQDIDFAFADHILRQGGSALQMSRHKPKDEEFSTDFFVKHNVELLVTIGGDDTASTANRISKYLKTKNVSIQNIHVPKTIDNDLPLPEGPLDHIEEELGEFAVANMHSLGDHVRVGMGPDHRTDDVVGIHRVPDPVPDGFIGGILQGLVSTLNRDYLCSKHPHFFHIGCLAFHIQRTHIHHTMHTA